MANRNHERSRIANNRLAAAIAVGSVIAVIAVGLLYRVGLLDFLVPARGPPVDALPLYLLVAVIVPLLVFWSWSRLLSWFR